MGLKVEPAYIGQAGYNHPVELDRNLLEGLFTKSGAFRYGDFSLSQGVGTRAILVGSGRYFVLGTENAQQGGYFVWSDAGETFLLAAAVGNPRIDTILIRVIDSQYGSISGAPRAEFAVVQGVAAASPTARPDSDFNVGGAFYIPGAWARLGDVRVNVADTGSIPTGQITTANQHVRGPAAYVPCMSTARPSDPRIGDRIHELNTGMRRYWNGTLWQQAEPYQMSIDLASNAADINLTGIPSTLRRLRVEYFIKCAAAAEVENLLMRVSGIASNHAYNHTVQQNTSVAGLTNDQGNTHFPVGIITGSSVAPAEFFGSGVIEVINWNAVGGRRPRFHWQTGCYGNTSLAAYNAYGQGILFSNGPYTSLRFYTLGGSQLVTNSYVVLDGWE